jgi:hypothetical protein
MKLVLFRPKLRKYLKSNLNPNTGTAIPLILIGTFYRNRLGTYSFGTFNFNRNPYAEPTILVYPRVWFKG